MQPIDIIQLPLYQNESSSLVFKEEEKVYTLQNLETQFSDAVAHKIGTLALLIF